jgi:cytochrome c biogenesis protein CcmG/thiol:disulfide interchange protein DsbE
MPLIPRPLSGQLDAEGHPPHGRSALGEKSDRVIWGIVALAAAGVLVLAIAHQRGRGHSEDTTRAAASNAPSIALPLLDGSGKSSIAKGRVTVVDFWATWCAPCRSSMPRVQTVWKDYRRKGVDLFSVDTDDPGAGREAEVQKFLQENRLEFPVVLDDGSATSAFSVAGLPTMVVVGRDGQVLWNHVGTLTSGGERELRDILDRAIASN